MLYTISMLDLSWEDMTGACTLGALCYIAEHRLYAAKSPRTQFWLPSRRARATLHRIQLCLHSNRYLRVSRHCACATRHASILPHPTVTHCLTTAERVMMSTSKCAHNETSCESATGWTCTSMACACWQHVVQSPHHRTAVMPSQYATSCKGQPESSAEPCCRLCRPTPPLHPPPYSASPGLGGAGSGAAAPRSPPGCAPWFPAR